MPKFVPRQRKHKVLARSHQNTTSSLSTTQDANTNTPEILPAQQREREDRKKALKEELVRENTGKISAKKKKRLDKYVDTKIKKEENLVLLKKLAGQKIDTGLFRSARNLGRGEETKRERLRRAVVERSRGIDVEENEGVLFVERVLRDAGHEGGSEVNVKSAVEMKKGNWAAAAGWLYGRVFFPDGVGNHEKTRGLQNKALSLPKEDLDEAPKSAVARAESGAWKVAFGQTS